MATARVDEPKAWQIWADTGGTFTDCVGLSPLGELRRVKVPSGRTVRVQVLEQVGSDRLLIAPSSSIPPGGLPGWRLRWGALEVAAAHYESERGLLSVLGPLEEAPPEGAPAELLGPEPAPVLGARLLTGTPAGERLPLLQLRLATTRGTNALLERKGAPTVLFVTRGFGDLLRIGDQRRPDLFALAIRRPPPLVEVVVEVDERISSDGTILVPLRQEAVAQLARAQLSRGLRAAAVSLMHGARYPMHEQQLAALLRDLGFDHVSVASALSSELGLLARTQTAVVDATLASNLGEYLCSIDEAIEHRGFLVMTSAGGLVTSTAYCAKDCLLSGPAGGVVGAAAAARASGVDPVLSFDMGGTSTDVARVADGRLAYRFSHRVGDAELRAPAVAIETVAAGGGSICGFDGQRLRVGPESAGADPGPACYGGGGPLTLTDVNLLLGRLDARRFGIPLWPDRAKAALDALVWRVSEESGETASAEALLAGWLQIADERMAEAIREVSVRRGFAPAEHTLLAFGGAGGQHVCSIAQRLTMRRALVPADASLLSAIGLGAARLERFEEQSVLAPLQQVEGQLAAWCSELENAGRLALASQSRQAVEVDRRLIEVRMAGQETPLQLDWTPGQALAPLFVRSYQAQYGYEPAGRALEVVMLRVVVSTGAHPPPHSELATDPRAVSADQQLRSWFGDWMEVPVFEWTELLPGDCAPGPALVVEEHTTVAVLPGWSFALDAHRALLLERSEESQ